MAGLTLKGAVVAGLVAVASALPSLVRRQQSAAEQALGINDLDVLQFALTLEHLEAAFYQQGFAAIPQQQFLDLGLTQLQVDDLILQGKGEAAHVGIIQSTLAQQGAKPVEPCVYNFGDALASATNMVKLASTLETVGVSAYLGAAPILAMPGVLAAAASIFSIEARHQTFIRAVSKVASAPDFFDTPLSPKQVFTLAAPFITSCPDGSNLVLTANPALSLTDPAQALTPNANLALTSDASAAATACAFISGSLPTGATFTAFANGACILPEGLTGVVYLNLVNAIPPDGKIADAIVVAGPTPLVLQ